MPNRTMLEGAYRSLTLLVDDFLKSLDGIPEEDLNTWKPSAAESGGGEMNTLAAMGVHCATAGTWMLVHQVYGKEFPRDRDAEFEATATVAQIEALFREMLSRFRELIDCGEEIDLEAAPPTVRERIPDWNRAAWLFHAIDHTALHVGHAQIMRQLWLAERSSQAWIAR